SCSGGYCPVSARLAARTFGSVVAISARSQATPRRFAFICERGSIRRGALRARAVFARSAVADFARLVRRHRRDNQTVHREIEDQFEAADVAPVDAVAARPVVDFTVPNLRLTRRAFPGHGETVILPNLFMP